MPLLTHGFLGADAGQARKQILRKYSQLFAVLRELNDVSHEYLRGLRLDLQNEFHIFTVTYFIRGLSTFQSLIILLEHGCIDDARALCRTLLHTHFRLAAIAAKPSVLNRIRATGISEGKKRLESYKIGQRKIPPGSRSVDLDAQIKAAEVQLKKLGRSEITEKQLAEIGGCDYDIQYAVLSDAAHGSLSDLGPSVLKFDRRRRFLGYVYGPSDKDLATYAVYAADLQRGNLTNTDKTIRHGLPVGFAALQERRIQLRSDMPGIF